MRGVTTHASTVDIGMMITNCWKLFHCGVKRDHYEKLIRIREFSEQIAVSCFINTFTEDTGNLVNSIPSLDNIDNKVAVYNYQRLNYSSSSPCSSEIITISDITIATDPTTDIGHTDSNEV